MNYNLIRWTDRFGQSWTINPHQIVYITTSVSSSGMPLNKDICVVHFTNNSGMEILKRDEIAFIKDWLDALNNPNRIL